MGRSETKAEDRDVWSRDAAEWRKRIDVVEETTEGKASRRGDEGGGGGGGGGPGVYWSCDIGVGCVRAISRPTPDVQRAWLRGLPSSWSGNVVVQMR